MSTLVQIPEGVREGDSRLIHLTDPAVLKVDSLRAREENGEYLRVAISGGGCNGLSYRMKFVDQTRKGDIAVRFGDVVVLVDSKSALYLKGTILIIRTPWSRADSSSQIPMRKPAAPAAKVSAFEYSMPIEPPTGVDFADPISWIVAAAS